MPIGWQKFVDEPQEEADTWSLFHENSKTGRHDAPIPNNEVLARMEQMWDALVYEGYDRIALPEQMASLDMPVGETLLARSSARGFVPAAIPLDQLATILHCGYGVTRDNDGGPFPRPFRTVPSGGALYPLELYVHTAYAEGLSAGLYHFNPSLRCLRLLQRGDSARQIGEALVQPNLAFEVSALVFITAIFERSVFKYNDRGYRFILLEAGHVAQNLNIAATALGLGCINIGGFFDRDIDRFLGLDGVRSSVVYLVGIGRERKE
jgi:SagB-type dehydrogenase family enzyme